MPLLHQVLSHLSSVSKPQRNFLAAFFPALFHFFGRATRANIARHGGPSERTQARWEQRPLDFPAMNLKALELEGVLDHPMAAILDASHLPKSGKETWGLGRFWNGSHARVEWGLEISTLALVDLQEETAYALDTRQTPAVLAKEENRMDFYLEVVQAMRGRLPAQVKYLLIDGGYTKKNFIDGIIKEGLHVVGKLRKDANLLYLYTGPRQKGRGRPKKFDGKVNFNELSRWEPCLLVEGEEARWAQGVWHVSLKREVKVVLIQHEPKKAGQKVTHTLLFSTDVRLSADEICRLYKLRFQIEFLFRDGKQHTGLGEGQMRSQEGQHFHMNAAMTALNFMRLEERRQDHDVYSLGSAKKHNYNDEIFKVIFHELGLDAESPANQVIMQKVRSYGALAA